MTRQKFSHAFLHFFSLLFFCVLSSVLCAQGFYDDFSDGSATDDNPVTWTPYPETTMSVDDGDLAVSGSFRFYNQEGNIWVTVGGATQADRMFSDVSARTQLTILEGNGVSLAVRASDVGATADQYFLGLASGGGTAIYRVRNGTSEILDIFWETGLNPTIEEVVMQIDAIGDTLNGWVWRAGDPMPTAPVVTAIDSQLTEGYVSFDASEWLVDRNPAALVRYVWVDTKHIPEPSSFVLGLFGLLGLTAFRRHK